MSEAIDTPFADEMAAMAKDAEIQAECAAIAEEFRGTDLDGLDVLGPTAP